MHPALVALGAVALAGGAAAIAFKDKLFPHKAAPPPPGTPVTPAGNPTLPATVNPLDEAKKAAAANLGPLPDGYKTYAEWVQKSAPSLPQAHALHDFLKANGVTGSAQEQELTRAFQKAHNSNRITSGIGGQLDEDGEYDALTSAALTLYTGDPIPGNPNAKPPKTATLGEVLTNKVIGQGGTNVGSAMSSGFNVKQYLTKQAPNFRSPGDDAQKALVLQFQHDINTDPLFPGPSYAPSPKPPIMFQKVIEDGDLGPIGSVTRKALKYQTDPDSEKALYDWL